MSWMNGKENIKVANRLLFEKDVIKAVDKHTKDDYGAGDYAFLSYTNSNFYTQQRPFFES